MNLADKKTIRELLKKYGAKPEKYLGQHFILSDRALNEMIQAAAISNKDAVVEIGPGLGALTQKIAETGAKIVAVEKDGKMIEILREITANRKNVKIVHADARRFTTPTTGAFKIVANLPYSIATFLIRRWLEADYPPQNMVLMVQKEVAQRICERPPKTNLLAASVQFFAEAKIIDYVPAEAFWPRPKIDSAIIKIIPYEKKPPQKTRDKFFTAVKAGFSQPRKQLIGNLEKKLNIPKEKLIKIFSALDIPANARAENLSVEKWIILAKKINR